MQDPSPQPVKPVAAAQTREAAFSDLLRLLATVPQPKPVHCAESEPVEPMVLDWLLGGEGMELLGEDRAREAAALYSARIEYGRVKYGQELHTFNGRNVAADLLQENLDGLGYAVWAHEECEQGRAKLEDALTRYECQCHAFAAGEGQTWDRREDHKWMRASGLRSAHLQRAALLRGQISYYGAALKLWFETQEVLGLGWGRADLASVLDGLWCDSPAAMWALDNDAPARLFAALPSDGSWAEIVPLAASLGIQANEARAAALWLVGPWGEPSAQINRSPARGLWLMRREVGQTQGEAAHASL